MRLILAQVIIRFSITFGLPNANKVIYLCNKKAKSHLGEVWSGYLELLRAEGFC